MKVEGFVEYKRREFCKDVNCPVQVELNKQLEGSLAYEQMRKKCGSGCLYTTWHFHHWLIEKGYILLVSAGLKSNERTVLVNLDKALADWVDQQVTEGKFENRDGLIEKAVAQYRMTHEK